MRLLSARRVLSLPVATFFLAGCGAHAPKTVPAAPPQEVALTFELPDDAFAESLHAVLLDRGGEVDEAGRLAGVLDKQLTHALERFDAGWHDRGLATLQGAMLLVRPGELRAEVLKKNARVLDQAYRHVAPKGDEGAALALLNLSMATTAEGSPERKEVEEKLHALERWLEDTRTASPLEVTARDQRVAAARALLEPTREAHDAARDATIAWIEQAVAFGEHAHSSLVRPKREQTVEAFRAFQSGAGTLVALSLRHGDVNTALLDLERTPARQLVAPELHRRLEIAASGGDAGAFRSLLAAWIELFGTTPDPDRGGSEIAIDPELFRAATWGIAREVLRRDPGALDAAMPVALISQQVGMPEVAPLLLVEAVEEAPEPRFLSAALGVVLQGIAYEDESDDLASARRTFRAAEPLLTLASRPESKGKLQPSAARIRILMAAVEMKAGQLEAARALLEEAVREEGTADAYVMLSAIERQAGKLDRALDNVDRALALPQVKQEATWSGELSLTRYDLLRDTGADETAGAELAKALEQALVARERAKTPGAHARAERLLSRVLERYGDSAGTARAVERAYIAATSDRRQLSALAIDEAARALVRKDVAAARLALTRALDANLEDEDVVYIALWLMLVEKTTNTPPDGTATTALARIKNDRWLGRLASWGLGKLKDQDLLEAARTPHQKTEALFYAAMARRISGAVGESDASLREIANSPNIDLVEVRIAKELLDPPKPFPGGLPKGTKIP